MRLDHLGVDVLSVDHLISFPYSSQLNPTGDSKNKFLTLSVPPFLGCWNGELPVNVQRGPRALF